MPHFDIAHEVGSREFLRPLTRLGVPARLRSLEYGDFAFYGNGPSGTTRVGIERKKVDELTGEASRKRFISRQLPGMIRRYPLFRFVIIEGASRVDLLEGELLTGKDVRSRKTGRLMTIWLDGQSWGRGYTFERWVKEQMTVRLKGGIHFITTASAEETAHWLHACYRWFQKDWSEHKSAYQLDTAVDVDQTIIDERTFRRDVLAKFPGVGWVRSARVAKRFRSVAEAVGATEDEWMRALGIKQGRKIARRLVNVLHGKDESDAKGS